MFLETSFPETLKALRKKKNMTQNELSKIFGVATATIAMWETGKREPDSSTLMKLANFFNVSVDYLLSKKQPENQFLSEGVDFALWGEVKDLTEAQKQDILNYIKYKKFQQYIDAENKAGENKNDDLP